MSRGNGIADSVAVVESTTNNKRKRTFDAIRSEDEEKDPRPNNAHFHLSLPPAIISHDQRPAVKKLILVLCMFLILMYIFAGSIRHDHKPTLHFRKGRSQFNLDFVLKRDDGFYSANSATYAVIAHDLEGKCIEGHIPGHSPTCGADGCLKILKGSPRLTPPVKKESLWSISDIEGTLHMHHATFIKYMTQMQWDYGLYGSVGEIGVYHGKMTALLAAYSAPDMGERIFICDTFTSRQHVQFRSMEGRKDQLEKSLELVGLSLEADKEYKRVRMWDDSSVYLSKSLYHKMDLPAFRIYSIDGSANLHIVLHDLHHVTCVLRDGGIIILQDHRGLGLSAANETIQLFNDLYGSDIIKPFLYAYEKVYLCPTEWHYRYSSYLEKKGVAHVLNLCKGYGNVFGDTVYFEPCEAGFAPE